MGRSYLSARELIEHLEPLLAARTGLLFPATELSPASGNPRLHAFSATLADPSFLHESFLQRGERTHELGGAGGSLDRETALVKAVCEALERYAQVVHDPSRVIVATAGQLGAKALDPNVFPRCSGAELGNPKNFLRNRDPEGPLRWLPGIDLATGQERFVPLVAAYLTSGYEYPAEAFTQAISTGSAIAASYERALISGICELVERDALMIAWLQCLELPRIEVAHPSAELATRLERLAMAGLEQTFLDATTDLEIPVVVGIQIAANNPLSHIVLAASNLDPETCLEKVVDEATTSRIGLTLNLQQPLPFDPDDFSTITRLIDGALLYGDPARGAAFDCWLSSRRSIALEALPNWTRPTLEEGLDDLIDHLGTKGIELVAVDITVPVLRELGLFAVKVISPQLMPLITNHNIRYLATPRLYDAPRRMGYVVRSESELNPWPQPFA